ncbi:bifunctional N-acetylglucosamine-1-phosphate uridyltransferase/glucosamine-1-phosphate acetyltransferase [Ornatilinea apprima]|uniref:Bifunctional protein GlmU n=1 Tax=Ornatilinea apprima TaxID=1134406 RepID=A0A0P6XUG9_9CHLR|nr:bifunctional UDP-N-acetylglucosamine diphosphorylase/glucosamine-1-phosphate N-acetyltransferase GlmU [Ornatilinea apprima]KPL77039.1 bifunctional N-acetylglucosamine-1-phosphate uridyltransferase/glucosamine-1-phosphate acetyltransferase [Ornatilinea apprima]
MNVSAVILAAGQGTRMRSKLPKVLHPICGRPQIEYSLRAAAGAGAETIVVVVGHGAEQVREVVGERAVFALQEQQLGTAHALQSARSQVSGSAGLVLVISADMPLLTGETLSALVEAQRGSTGALSLLTVISDHPRGFGRVVRGPDGLVVAIVEERDCTPEQLAIRELNVAAYCFNEAWLWGALERVKKSPKGEYYLTDVVALAAQDGLKVNAIVLQDPAEAMGINTRVHLAEAEAVMRQRINQRHMLNGVTLIDPATTFIEDSVQIGMDTVVWPNTYLRGSTHIGEDCQIGPNTMMDDCQVGNRCKVLAAVMEKAVLEDDVDMGPFARLRKGAHLAQHVHMGNFGEVKDSYLGPGTKMGHFSYIGNAQIGPDVNIGAGTITCNYDGVKKHPTEIGANVFIGSDTMLVAPLKIGDNSKTGAGSVVTHDVPPDTVVVGVPARPLTKKTERHDG